MADFVDGNTWYWMTESRVNFTSALFYDGTNLYFGANDTSSNNMYWQIYQLPSGNFQFRNRGSNTLKQLGACYDQYEVSSSKTQPCMNASTAATGQEWTIDSWGDGSYKIQNVANGTGYNLDWHPGNPGFLNPVTAATPTQPAQHWYFSSIGLVNDGLYSTSIMPSSTSATSAGASTFPGSASASATGTTTGASGGSTTSSGSPSQQKSSSSSGLSGGAAAGIGVGVAVVVIGVAALAFFLFWRRKRQPKPEVSELAGGYNGAPAVPANTYEKVGPVHEVPTNTPSYEMYTVPSELPASGPESLKR